MLNLLNSFRKKRFPTVLLTNVADYGSIAILGEESDNSYRAIPITFLVTYYFERRPLFVLKKPRHGINK